MKKKVFFLSLAVLMISIICISFAKSPRKEIATTTTVSTVSVAGAKTTEPIEKTTVKKTVVPVITKTNTVEKNTTVATVSVAAAKTTEPIEKTTVKKTVVPVATKAGTVEETTTDTMVVVEDETQIQNFIVKINKDKYNVSLNKKDIWVSDIFNEIGKAYKEWNYQDFVLNIDKGDTFVTTISNMDGSEDVTIIKI